MVVFQKFKGKTTTSKFKILKLEGKTTTSILNLEGKTTTSKFKIWNLKENHYLQIKNSSQLIRDM